MRCVAEFMHVLCGGTTTCFMLLSKEQRSTGMNVFVDYIVSFIEIRLNVWADSYKKLVIRCKTMLLT